MPRCWRRRMLPGCRWFRSGRNTVKRRSRDEMEKAPRQTFPPPRVKLAGDSGALTAPIRRIRFAYVALFFCAWTALIAVRLGWLQVVRHSDFVHRAAMQQQRTFEVGPP